MIEIRKLEKEVSSLILPSDGNRFYNMFRSLFMLPIRTRKYNLYIKSCKSVEYL